MRIKFLLAFALICVVVYTVGALALYNYQRKMLYIPSPEYAHEFESLELQNGQEILKVAVLNSGQSRAIIYFGGNAEAVIFNAEPFLKHFRNYTVYLANYRGYGGSTGSPSELGLYSDSLALYDQVRTKHESISLMGRSLGSGVAAFLGSQRRVSQLALITPYDSIENVAQAHVPIYPVGLLIKDKYDSVEKAARVSAQVLIVMAELDLIIPNSHSIKLLEAFKQEQVSTLIIKGANHNNVSLDPEYYPRLKRFFDSEL